jgi:hypothetical protein
MKFKSKVDWWLHLFFAAWVGGNVWAIVSLAINHNLGSLIITIVFSPITAFLIVPIRVRTYYLFGDSGLRIVCGLGKGKTIAYDAIESVAGTRSPLSSPALSIDRLEVRYKFKKGSFYDTVIISPKDSQGFFESLKQKNENIQINTDFKPMSKKMKLAILLGVGSPLAAVAGMFIYGEAEPVIRISDSEIQISSMYGLNIDFVNIDSIELIEQSMRKILSGDPGTRTNGYNGFGGTLKGHFRSRNLGTHMLFVRTDSSPTIKISRNNGGAIFISLRSSEATREAFSEMVRSFELNLG